LSTPEISVGDTFNRKARSRKVVAIEASHEPFHMNE